MDFQALFQLSQVHVQTSWPAPAPLQAGRVLLSSFSSSSSLCSAGPALSFWPLLPLCPFPTTLPPVHMWLAFPSVWPNMFTSLFQKALGPPSSFGISVFRVRQLGSSPFMDYTCSVPSSGAGWPCPCPHQAAAFVGNLAASLFPW